MEERQIGNGDRLGEQLWERYGEEYRARLLPQLDAAEPYFFPFKRILCWGQRA